jgi:hypothetical protein
MTTLFVALFVGLALPTLAVAKVTVPPGSTEGDQYFEEAPNGGGSNSIDKGGVGGAAGGGGAGGSGAVSPVAATKALNALGPDGKAAADLANANRPPEGLKAHPISNPPAPASSPTDGEGGLGVFFPLLIIGTVLAGGAYVLRRRLNPA